MAYDPNGFNYQGKSILSYYDTTYANTFSTVASNFNKNGIDIATLITPAAKNSKDSDATTRSLTNAGYTGFPTKGIISFDTAFTAAGTLVNKPTIDIADCGQRGLGTTALGSNTGTWADGTNTCYSLQPGSFIIRFPTTLSTGSASGVYAIGGNKTFNLLMIAGGGGALQAYSPYGEGAPSGAAAGALVTADIVVSPTITPIRLSSFFGWGVWHIVRDWQIGGTSTVIKGSSQVTAYGGQGAKYHYNAPPNLGGSTAGASKPDNFGINGTVYANEVDTSKDGAASVQLSDNCVLQSKQYFRNHGGANYQYGWSGGGGGGAGAAGNRQGGDYNRGGGHGGATKEVWGIHWAGGGGGAGDPFGRGGAYDGASGGAEWNGSGTGGNTKSLSTATRGYDGSVNIRFNPNDFSIRPHSAATYCYVFTRATSHSNVNNIPFTLYSGASTQWTWTGANNTLARVLLVGGGGGGGYSNAWEGGGGGGGGAVQIGQMTLVNATYTIVCGEGTDNTSANGSASQIILSGQVIVSADGGGNGGSGGGSGGTANGAYPHTNGSGSGSAVYPNFSMFANAGGLGGISRGGAGGGGATETPFCLFTNEWNASHGGNGITWVVNNNSYGGGGGGGGAYNDGASAGQGGYGGGIGGGGNGSRQGSGGTGSAGLDGTGGGGGGGMNRHTPQGHRGGHGSVIIAIGGVV
jgi:hypothetical protein